MHEAIRSPPISGVLMRFPRLPN